MKSILPSLWGGDEKPFASLHKEVDRLFEDFSKHLPASDTVFGGKVPAIDVAETDAGVDVTAELPGVDEADVDVTVNGRLLTIKGEKRAEKETKEKDYHLTERSYGSFRRTLTLPFEPDASAVKAKFDKGVLTIHLPKSKEEMKKATRIKIGKG